MRIALALIACAGLGSLAGLHPVLPTDSRSSEPGPEKSAVTRIGPAPAPVETPLVEKLLVKEPDHIAEPSKMVDGQLSPGGQWRWNEAQWAWIPVKQSGPAWVQDGHSATIDHLVNEHGYSRASLASLTQQQLDVLHSNAHNAARAAAPVRGSGCPGGVCPSPSRSRGLFRRR